MADQFYRDFSNISDPKGEHTLYVDTGNGDAWLEDKSGTLIWEGNVDDTDNQTVLDLNKALMADEEE